ncbi:MAG TPA: DUF3108 domain-containing protein [Bryobacteraceae bacterium]|jgi:hypothetical protein|nr:DUF3108 domain-containing protein [Bryobacteraceae bacterium]
MLGLFLPRRLAASAALCCLLHGIRLDGQSSPARQPPPAAETLSYTVEWRLITAGTAKLTVQHVGTDGGRHASLLLQSTGLVSKLFRVNDVYDVDYHGAFCAGASHMLAQEGRRRRETTVTYDALRKKADYLERDLLKNTVVKMAQVDIPACVHDVVGALLQLRTMNVDVGHSVELPVSDGKKSAMVRVEAQEREDLKIKNVAHKTVRYEAFLFNNVIYSRKGSVQLWLTDDSDRIPVQIKLRMQFPIGNITLTLDKQELS